MLRKIIRIDEDNCNGCGLCADACHEGAIAMVDGKAKLVRDDYCDGLGDCLPVCPTGAIRFEEREAAAYDEAAVKARQAAKGADLPCGCPGTALKSLHRTSAPEVVRRQGPQRKANSCSGRSKSNLSPSTPRILTTPTCLSRPIAPRSPTATSTSASLKTALHSSAARNSTKATIPTNSPRFCATTPSAV